MSETEYIYKSTDCPTHCPKCGTDNVYAKTDYPEGVDYTIEIHCMEDCGFEWFEHFTYVGWEPKD